MVRAGGAWPTCVCLCADSVLDPQSPVSPSTSTCSWSASALYRWSCPDSLGLARLWGGECEIGCSLRRLKVSKGPKSKMAGSCSIKPCTASRNLESPNINRKTNDYKDCSVSSISLDSGYSDALSTSSFNHSDTHHDIQMPKNISLLCERSGKDAPTSQLTMLSPITSESSSNSTLDRKEAHASSFELCETPKVTQKSACLRRRLLLSKTSSSASFDYFHTPEESNYWSRKKQPLHQALSIEQSLLAQFDESPLDSQYTPIATSTLKSEEPIALCQKRRLAFVQQRTSTVDESKCDESLSTGSECISPALETDSGDCELSLAKISDVNPGDNLLKTPDNSKVSETVDEQFFTPISNLAARFNFRLSDFNTPLVEKAINLDDSSTRDDSAFISLSLNKSHDSLTDHEGSFQELLQNRSETPRGLNTKCKLRTLERSKRLSTLRERGSQSEAEEEVTETELISWQYKLRAVRDSVEEEEEVVEHSLTEEQNEDCLLKIDDLTGTPALRIVHEMLIRSKRKRPEENTIQDIVGSAEEDEINKSENILSKLIGRKMGLEKMDILMELKYRNLKHVLAIILGVLNSKSICSIWKVSKGWREIVVQDKHAHRRRTIYIKNLKAETEHGHLVSVEDAATRLKLLNRSALKSVQAQAKCVFQTPTPCRSILTPKSCNPISLSGSKQEEYVKVAKTLFTDEALKPCPRCQYPAKYQPVKKRAICSRQDCAFDFCILCLCSFHGSKECTGSSTRRRSGKDALPGSTQSKRNLRRL